MKKSIIAFLICLLLILFRSEGTAQETQHPPRGLFVSVVQNPHVLSSRKEIARLIRFAKEAGIQTLFVQIYHGNKAWFRSSVADPEPYEICRRYVGTDPFAWFISEAHKAGMEVHAWLNILSLGGNEDAPLLKKYGPRILTQDIREKRELEDYRIDGQYFLEPGDPNVRQELAKIVAEVLLAYPALDGVQFDYLRYPDVHPTYGHTAINIDRFKKATGIETVRDNDPAWQTWRRNQVTEFAKLLVKKVRAIRPGVRISVTGCMPYARAYYEAFQDWPSWVDSGLVDFVTIMNYSPDPETFGRWLSQIRKKVRDFNKVNIAVGAYRLEKTPEIFAKEFDICEKAGGGACVAFHYGSLLTTPALQALLVPRPMSGAPPLSRD